MITRIIYFFYILKKIEEKKISVILLKYLQIDKHVSIIFAFRLYTLQRFYQAGGLEFSFRTSERRCDSQEVSRGEEGNHGSEDSPRGKRSDGTGPHHPRVYWNGVVCGEPGGDR